MVRPIGVEIFRQKQNKQHKGWSKSLNDKRIIKMHHKRFHKTFLKGK